MILVPRKAIVSLSLLFFSFSALAQQEKSLDPFKWLKGFWVNSDSTAVEQWWNEGTMLVGSVNKVEDINKYFDPKNKSEILEQLELKLRGNKIVYAAKTKEHSWISVDFIYEPRETKSFSFYNPTNDFPKWIIYKPINTETLLITLKNDEKSVEFYYYKITP